MDQATILKILENHGAPPTQENINRVMQQSGRGTELLGRSMGLQGGMDESGRGLDLMLDKHMQSTGRSGIAPNTEPQINPNSMSDGAAQNGGARGNGAAAPTASPRIAAPARPTAHNEATGSPLQQSGIDVNSIIVGPRNTVPPHEPGMQVNGNVDAALDGAPMSMQDYALAAGIPLGTAAVGYALYQKLASLDGTVKMQPSDIAAINTAANDPKVLSRLDDLYPQGQGPEHRARLMAEINAENAALGFKPKAPAPAEAAVDKVAADTAKPAPATKPAEPTKAVPRTATPEVAGPTRDAAVVNDGVAAAERAKSNAALKPAEKPARVPPAKDVGPVPSIKETYPQHTPIPKGVLPSGPVEPQGEMRQMLNDLIEALKKSKIKRAP